MKTPKTTATASPTRDPSDVPRNLNSIVNTNSVTLDWDPPSVDPDGYLILRRSQGDADYIEIDILFAADSEDPTTYSDERLVSADTYEYVVMAIFLDGDASDVSEPVSVVVAGRGFGIADCNGRPKRQRQRICQRRRIRRLRQRH